MGFANAIAWLDRREQAKRIAQDAKIASMETRIAHLENGHAAAQALIVEAITMLGSSDIGAVQKKLMEACRVLA